jgi:HSP20 family protein
MAMTPPRHSSSESLKEHTMLHTSPFEQLFGLRAGSLAPVRSVPRGSFPHLNIGNTAEAVDVLAFAPGIDAASLDVTVDKGMLTISGQRQPGAAQGSTPSTPSSTAAPTPPTTVHTRERASGSFRRVIALPEDADPERVEASYRSGVLKVRIHKRDSARPRRITVA